MHRQGTFIRGTDRAGSMESIEAVDSFALKGREPRVRIPIETTAGVWVRGSGRGQQSGRGAISVKGIFLRA